MSLLIRTPPRPRRFYEPNDWNLALPTSEVLTVGTGSPYAGGELKYSNATAADIAQSEAAEIDPNVGDYADRDWLFPQKGPDGKWEVVFRTSIWGSPSSPFSGSDHTRCELRGIKRGPTNSGSTRGDFKVADRMFMEGEFRPLQFPARDRDGVDSATGNNLTMMQLHPVDSLDAAASSVFSIMALRKNGQLQCTLTNADGTNAATTHGVPIILLSGVQLGDVIQYELTTEADRLEWRAVNVTRAPGTIVTMTQSIPNVSSGGVTQRTRFQYPKAGCYHATGVDKSLDAAKAVNGVIPRRDITDFAAVAYRYVRYRYLTAA
ncbi:MAG: hypothetical protein C0434_08065 [Xanthomonadaceae bacterium]|nr:hypothetical protein [Xanthomonadaceae bacterium]